MDVATVKQEPIHETDDVKFKKVSRIWSDVFQEHILIKINMICHSRYAHCRNSVIVSNIKYKVEVASLHTIKGNGGMSPVILNLGARWRWVDNFSFISSKAGLVPNQYKARWAPVLVSVLWTRVKSLDSARNRTAILWLSSP
jgi:hypothetical protein